MRHFSARCLFLVFFAMVSSVFAFAQDRNVLASQINSAEIHITNSSDIAAYHSRLPLSTTLKVTNLDNFKSVEVKVIGRVSGSPGQMLLLSEEAARIIGLEGSDQIPVRVDVLGGQTAMTIPLESFDDDSLAEEQPDWEDEEREDVTPSYSAEADPPSPPPPPPAASVVPDRPAPQPPVRTVVPDQPPPAVAVTRPQTQAGASGNSAPVRVTITVNERDYVFEIPGDGQTPRAVSVTPAGPPTYVPPATPYYAPPAPATPPPPPPAAAAARTAPQNPPAGNAATIIPSIPDPNSNAVYRVQVGSYQNRNIARVAFDRLKNAGFNPSYEPYNNMFRVVIPGIKAADIPQVARRLGAAGFTSAWIRREN